MCLGCFVQAAMVDVHNLFEGHFRNYLLFQGHLGNFPFLLFKYYFSGKSIIFQKILYPFLIIFLLGSFENLSQEVR